MAIEVRPATVFEDVEAVIGPKNPASSVCFCLSYRIPSKENNAMRGPERAARGQRVLGEGDLAEHLVGVRVLPRSAQLRRGVRVEVAVAAPHTAERHVQVDAEVALRVDRDVVRQGAVERRRVAQGQSRPHQAGVVNSGEIARR